MGDGLEIIHIYTRLKIGVLYYELLLHERYIEIVALEKSKSHEYIYCIKQNVKVLRAKIIIWTAAGTNHVPYSRVIA